MNMKGSIKQEPLAAERHIYIYICRAVRSLKSWTTYIYIYIYVATSVTNFGAILFTPNMHTAEICFAVDSWRSGLHCVATVAPPAPSTPLKSPSFICQHIPAAHLLQLTKTVPDTARLFMAWKGFERGLNINIGLQNKQELLTRKFSVAYCSAYS